LQNRRTYR